MKPAAWLLCMWPAVAGAEDLSKFTKGLLLTSDCEAEICRSYSVAVAKKFVRLPITRQLFIVRKFCAGLDETATQYEDAEGHDWKIGTCIFTYKGEDIIYRAIDGQVYPEGWYVAALAALRD